MIKLYYPYKSDKPKYKYYVIIDNNNDGKFKRVYFGAAGYSDMTIHKNEDLKNRYILRHKKNENWTRSGINTAGWWSRWLLWNKPTIKESYNYIKQNFL